MLVVSQKWTQAVMMKGKVLDHLVLRWSQLISPTSVRHSRERERSSIKVLEALRTYGAPSIYVCTGTCDTTQSQTEQIEGCDATHGGYLAAGTAGGIVLNLSHIWGDYHPGHGLLLQRDPVPGSPGTVETPHTTSTLAMRADTAAQVEVIYKKAECRAYHMWSSRSLA